MFGQNPVRKPAYSPVGWLYVQDIFPTIQGEGPYSGMPAVFVRLSGCNLRCFFCDTDFETKRRLMTGKEILDEVYRSAREHKKAPTKLLVLTGGEPLIQNISYMCQILALGGEVQVQVETAGTIWPSGGMLEELVKKGSVELVCSPKTEKVAPQVADLCRHWKYLIREGCVDPDDGLPNMSTQDPGRPQRIFRPPRASDTVWLQPCEEYHDTVRFAAPSLSLEIPADQKLTESFKDAEKTQRNVKLCAELAMKHGYRVSLQTHKLLGLP